MVSTIPVLLALALAQPGTPPAAPVDWREAEKPLLTDHTQLTLRDKFVKAGEAYFDHQSPPRWIVFQAVPVPEAGKEPDGFYAMYVAKLKYDGTRIVGIEEPVKISPEGSANTCGWFHPTQPFRVLFGSTMQAPASREKPGFRVGTRNYVWQFPDEMEIVERGVSAIVKDLPPDSQYGAQSARFEAVMKEYEPMLKQARSSSPAAYMKLTDQMFERLDKVAPDLRAVKSWTGAQVVFSKPKYGAECSYTKDGRFILYAQVREELTNGKDDADIWIYDTQTDQHHKIVSADGYDGGPFFSPDGTRICYRSDRKLDDKLQLFVADLKFENGVPVGIEREHQITANDHVNWAPFFHPSGKFIVYGTSEVSHGNYEIFAVEVPPKGETVDPAKLRHRRITSAPGADVLPVFSEDGKYLMWTAQRGPLASGETKPSSQVWTATLTTGSGTLVDPATLFESGASKP